jgi:hypothetical protein
LYFSESDEAGGVWEQEQDWVVGPLVEVTPSEPGEVNLKVPSEMSRPKVDGSLRAGVNGTSIAR